MHVDCRIWACPPLKSSCPQPTPVASCRPMPPRLGPPVILTVARLISRKGIDTVLRALPPLLELAPSLEYWIVGNGPARPTLGETHA